MSLARAAVLAVLASSHAGCGDDSPPAAETGAATSSTGGTTMAAAGSTMAAAMSSSGGSSTSGGTTSTSTADTTGASTSSSTGDSTDSSSSDGGSSSSTGAPLSPCEATCGVQLSCTDRWPSFEECEIACEANLTKAERFNVACRAAWEGLHECQGTLSCEDYARWQSPRRFPYPCLRQDEVLSFECDGQ